MQRECLSLSSAHRLCHQNLSTLPVYRSHLAGDSARQSYHLRIVRGQAAILQHRPWCCQHSHRSELTHSFHSGQTSARFSCFSYLMRTEHKFLPECRLENKERSKELSS